MVGGLVGRNTKIIRYCYNMGIVTGENKIGGLIGYGNGGVLENSYNTGIVKANNNDESSIYIGGIAGLNNSSIKNVYNIGIISFEKTKVNGSGEIEAYTQIGTTTITNSYYLQTEKEFTNNKGIELSFLEMQQQESFEGFDFDTIWQIDSNSDYYFPTLRGVENKAILPKNVETETIKTNSITIKSIEGYEYSIDGENYQDSNVFDNLTPFTEYTIYQRIKKTETTDESIAAYTSVKTLTYIGDINGDGKVNITDVALINAHVKKTKLLTGDELARADINGDGKVNITDVALVNAHVKKVKLLF